MGTPIVSVGCCQLLPSARPCTSPPDDIAYTGNIPLNGNSFRNKQARELLLAISATDAVLTASCSGTATTAVGYTAATRCTLQRVDQRDMWCAARPGLCRCAPLIYVYIHPVSVLVHSLLPYNTMLLRLKHTIKLAFCDFVFDPLEAQYRLFLVCFLV